MTIYPIELKDQIIREYKKGEMGYIKLGKKYHIPRSTIRDWILKQKKGISMKKLNQDLEQQYNLNLNDFAQQAKEMKFDNIEEELQFYKTASIYFSRLSQLIWENSEKESKKKTFKMIVNETIIDCKTNNSIKIGNLCKVAKIPHSTYCYRKNSEIIKREKDKFVLDLLDKLPSDERNTGCKSKSRFVKKRFNVIINHKKMERICREYGYLTGIRRRKHPLDYYKQQKELKDVKVENILKGNFESEKKFSKLVTDVSYFHTQSGWLYLSAMMDLYNNKIVAYVISTHNDENIILDTVKQIEDKLQAETIIHSDQGSIYKSSKYRGLIEEKGYIQSMSGKGRWWENACIESFFGRLKTETDYDKSLKTGYKTQKEVKEMIDNYIDFYNNRRIQKNLKWQTPSDFIA